MNLFIHILVLAAGIKLLSASFVYIFDPRRANDLLKKFGIVVVGLIFGLALIERLLTAVLGAGDFVWGLALFVLSVVAYFIREARNRKVRRPGGQGGRERTPVALPHLPEEEE